MLHKVIVANILRRHVLLSNVVKEIIIIETDVGDANVKDELNQIGMTWEEAKERCPEGIVPACHNAAGSVTISGAANVVTSFVAKIKEENGFVRKVDSNDIPFHSPHLIKAGKAYLAVLQKVWNCNSKSDNIVCSLSLIKRLTMLI